MPDRLFLFAAYDPDCIVDDALVYYVQTLSKYGDIILCTDCDFPEKEINKIKKYTVHTINERHGEYDFGSYKRAYQYASAKDILKNYKYLYLVNDSVFGPTIDITQTLKDMEALETDAAGIIISKHQTHKFMESWFVRINKKVFTSNWFNDFICGIKKESTKPDVTIKYEHGLSNLITNNNCSWAGLYTVYGRETYNHPKSLFRRKCPFIKKVSFTRHNGALGKQIKYVLKNCDKAAHDAITKTANRLYGQQYMNWFLTSNPLKISARNITYLIRKIRKQK